MNTSALIIMLTTIFLVTGLMIYFFYLVVNAPVRPEPDSFLFNDDDPDRQDPDKRPIE